MFWFCLLIASISSPCDEDSRYVWQAINDIRVEHKLEPFIYDPEKALEARLWVWAYPVVITDKCKSRIEVRGCRGLQHAPVGWYLCNVYKENVWMYAPTLTSVVFGYRSSSGWLDSELHKEVILSSKHKYAAVYVRKGYTLTPGLIPDRTGPYAAVLVVGDEC